MRPAHRAACLLLAVACPAFFGAGAARAEPEAPPRAEPAWEYRVAVGPDLDTLRVRICFRTYVPKRLMLGTGVAISTVDLPSEGAGGPSFSLDPDGRSVTVRALASGGCVEYGVPVARLLEGGRDGPRAHLAGGALVLRAGDVLLQPVRVEPGASATIAFDLPEGASVSAPWEPLVPGGARDATPSASTTLPMNFIMEETSFRYIGHLAIGRFDVRRISVAGATVDAALLPGARAATDDGIAAWLTTAAETVRLLHGKFPRPRLQVVVRPVRPGGDPVAFGSSWQGGGGAVLLDLSSDAKDADLPGEWVAIHEMTHLAMPVIEREDAWFSEGFATYYQEVLRARAGILSPQNAWQRIEDGFGRGRRGGGEASLAQESRAMFENHAFLRVYWAGAAIALLLDADLRRASDGRTSLDDAMRMLFERHGGSARVLSAAQAIAEIDAWVGRPAFASIAAPALASSRFPDVAASYAWLGVRVGEDGIVSLSGAAPGRAARDRITAR